MWAEAAETNVAVPSDAAIGVANPVTERAFIRGVIFDLDGTLYSQPMLRSLMAAEMALLPLLSPIRGWRCVHALASYRRAQESLRQRAAVRSDDQLVIASREAGLPLAEVEQIVSEWMIDRPLKYLRFCRMRGLMPLLNFLAGARVRLGVLSDYAPLEKLRALGLADRFSPVLCSTDPGIGALKPSPRGLLHVCRAWRLDPAEVLVVGDREDVDARSAAAAGMPCVIVGRCGPPSVRNCVLVSSFERLHRVLDGRG
jgi:HAD superfamily hydrolase (TIGR01509 family)